MFDLDALGIVTEEESGEVAEQGVGEVQFSFDEESHDFALSLVGSESKEEGTEEEEEFRSVEQMVAAMTVGQKIKLAYTQPLGAKIRYETPTSW